MIAAGLLHVPIRADDWPQWRGPNRDGVWNETGILETFPAGGLKFRWRVQVGFGWSSPVVAGGRVFLPDSHLVRPSTQERLHCFEEATGKPVWTFAYDATYPEWAFTPGQEAGPTATPIVEGERIYMVGGNGQVHCFEAAKGEVLWKKDLSRNYKIEILKCRASPLIENDLLIVFAGARPGACVMALDKNSGREVWKAVDEPVSNSSPIVIASGGKRQLIAWTEQSVTSLHPATGEVFWREPLVTSNNDAISSPVFEQDRLLISGLMLRLDPEKPAFSVLWPQRLAAAQRILSNTSTPLLRGDQVYSARSSGQLVCLEAATGKPVWETDKVTDLKGGASIHLTSNGDAAFLYTDRGELIRARLTPQGYREISRARLVEPVYPFGGRNVAWSPPSFANRHVFARTEKELVCASLAAEP